MANLLTGNSASFASGIADWNKTTGSGNFTLTHDAADGGVGKVEVTTGGSNIAVGSHLAGDAVKIPVTAGANITLGAKSKQLSGTARGWRVEGNFYDSGGTNHSNVTAATGTLTVGSYVTLSSVITVPANSVRMRLRVRWDTPGAGEIFYLDDAVIDDGAGALNLGNTRTYLLTAGAPVLLRVDGIS